MLPATYAEVFITVTDCHIPPQKWHECHASFCPPMLMVTEYEDLRLEVGTSVICIIT